MVDKTLQGLLVNMAHEDPNDFLEKLYHAGLEPSDIEELQYLVRVARRAPGYDAQRDLLLRHGVC